MCVVRSLAHIAYHKSSARLLGHAAHRLGTRLMTALLLLPLPLSGVLQQPGQQQRGTAAMAAYAAVRDAVMGLSHSGCVPRDMVTPLLFYAIPFLEADVLAFSLKDVQVLTRWLTDVTVIQEADEPAGGISGLHVRHIKDVRLALVRTLARSSVYAN